MFTVKIGHFSRCGGVELVLGHALNYNPAGREKGRFLFAGGREYDRKQVDELRKRIGIRKELNGKSHSNEGAKPYTVCCKLLKLLLVRRDFRGNSDSAKTPLYSIYSNLRFYCELIITYTYIYILTY